MTDPRYGPGDTIAQSVDFLLELGKEAIVDGGREVAEGAEAGAKALGDVWDSIGGTAHGNSGGGGAPSWSDQGAEGGPASDGEPNQSYDEPVTDDGYGTCDPSDGY